MRSCWFEDVEKLNARHDVEMQRRDRLVDRVRQELDERISQLREASLDYTIETQKTRAEFDAKLLRSTFDKDYELHLLRKQLNEAHMKLDT